MDRPQVWKIAGMIFLVCGLQLYAQQPFSAADAATFTTFDVPGLPGGSTPPFAATLPSGINPAGDITGIYNDPSDFSVYHSFVRAPNGVITTFDAPGALTQVSENCINPTGTIAGLYEDASRVPHGFLRASDGSFTTFDFPGTDTFVTTFIPSINQFGAVTGFYGDANDTHGFLRASDGTFTMFDVPGAFGETFALSINSGNEIAGYYVKIDDFTFHGFLRAPDGTFTKFDVPGATNTLADSINSVGAITGNYYDGNFVSHVFLRAPDGTFTTFDAPGAGTGPFQGTGSVSVIINTPGAITGNYTDDSDDNHGFLREPNGTITTFDVPGAGTGTPGKALPASINRKGEITGSYTNAADGTIRGFLRTP